MSSKFKSVPAIAGYKLVKICEPDGIEKPWPEFTSEEASSFNDSVFIFVDIVAWAIHIDYTAIEHEELFYAIPIGIDQPTGPGCSETTIIMTPSGKIVCPDLDNFQNLLALHEHLREKWELARSSKTKFEPF